MTIVSFSPDIHSIVTGQVPWQTVFPHGVNAVDAPARVDDSPPGPSSPLTSANPILNAAQLAQSLGAVPVAPTTGVVASDGSVIQVDLSTALSVSDGMPVYDNNGDLIGFSSGNAGNVGDGG